MQSMHADPADAVQIHRDLGSRLSVGMHWGSFRLSAEPPQHPPWRLFQELQAAGEAPEKFRVLEHGQALNF
jgi:N-acyl-phosphatidylethanolamine-hydrolysing phospholipase D